MHTKRLEQIGGGAGLVFVLLAIAYIFLSPPLEPTAAPSEVAKLYTDQQFGALFWNWVGSLSFFCYLFFLGTLYSILRRAEGGTGWLSLIAFSGGALFIAIHALETLSAYVLAWHAAPSGNLAVVQALFDLQNLVVYYDVIPSAAGMVASSLVIVSTRVLPRWIGWMGFVLAGCALVASAGIVTPQQGVFLIPGAVQLVGGLLIYQPALSIALIRRAGAAEETSRTFATETASVG
jgi:hypothetical protein